jgi:hypothetical protein
MAFFNFNFNFLQQHLLQSIGLKDREPPCEEHDYSVCSSHTLLAGFPLCFMICELRDYSLFFLHVVSWGKKSISNYPPTHPFLKNGATVCYAVWCGTHYADQAGFEPVVVTLPWPPKCRNYRCQSLRQLSSVSLKWAVLPGSSLFTLAGTMSSNSPFLLVLL